MRIGQVARVTALAVASVVALVLSLHLGGAARAANTPASRGVRALTDQQVAAMAPDVQARYLAPLRAAAEALHAYGIGKGANIFTAVGINANNHTVDLYVTEPDRAAAFEHSAAAAASDVDLNMVRVHSARHTRIALDRAVSIFLAARHPFAVYAASADANGAGITIQVRDSATVRAAGSTRTAAPAGPGLNGITIRYTAGTPLVPKSWNAAKWHDVAPFIGGDVLTANGVAYCTAGLPAVRKSDNVPVMVTAKHCFAIGKRIYTGAGATFQYGNRRLGSYVGRVTAAAAHWDAETIPAPDNADESDTSRWMPLSSVSYSYLGDYVCQSGQRSAALGHPTPCGIKVTNQDITYVFNGAKVRGVEGVDIHGWGSVNGDSGGTVFANLGHGIRQARGIISNGGKDGTADQRRVQWTEAVDIFRQFGLKLNPVQ